MSLNPELRAELLGLLPEAESAPPGPRLTAFVREHRAALIEEMESSPGVSQIRALAVRIVDQLADDLEHRRALLAAAARALAAPLDADAPSALARHPAWIGLCALELAEAQGGWGNDPIGRAAELAGAAFQATGVRHDLDEGEVLWAMAEQAADAGWTARADALLDRALDAGFADPAHRAQVRLLVAMRRSQRGEPAEELLRSVVDDALALDRERVHAAWILAHVRQEQGAHAEARALLDVAAECVDRDDDPQVAARIDATRRAWSGS